MSIAAWSKLSSFLVLLFLYPFPFPRWDEVYVMKKDNRHGVYHTETDSRYRANVISLYESGNDLVIVLGVFGVIVCELKPLIHQRVWQMSAERFRETSLKYCREECSSKCAP